MFCLFLFSLVSHVVEHSRDEGRRADAHLGGKEGSTGVGGQSHTVHIRLMESLRLGTPVLEPDLDLGLGEVKLIGELCPLGDAEVLLLLVLFLEVVQLLGSERCSWLPVSFVLAEMTLEEGQPVHWGLGHLLEGLRANHSQWGHGKG